MNMSRFRASALALVAAPTFTVLALSELASCSSSSAQPGSPSDGSADDSFADSTVDATEDSTADSPATPDVAQAVDTGTDANRADAGMDAGASSPDADAAPSAEAGACSVQVPPLGQFITVLANTVCQSRKSCCGTGARFDMAKCVSTYIPKIYGPAWMDVGFVQPFFDAGRIDYDPVAACQCLEGNANISCGLVPEAAWNRIEQACLSAVHGTVPAGDAGCASSYECLPGEYCTVDNATLQADASLGVCAVLVGDGGACTKGAECSYTRHGVPSLYCNGGACTPRLANGGPCQINETCASNICSCANSACSSLDCQGGVVFSDPMGSHGTCDYFTLPDAGADGG